MLDHVFSDAIGALREALESARLERQSLEERFHSDILLGNVTWETSYVLPGEGNPPRVHCDLTLEWPTSSQTSYRHWYLEGELGDLPEIVVAVVLRVQRLATSPRPSDILAVLPTELPTLGDTELEQSGPTVETIYAPGQLVDLDDPEWAIEISYEGAYELNEAVLDDGAELDEHFGDLGAWVSSSLVRLGDLRLDYRPADTSGN